MQNRVLSPVLDDVEKMLAWIYNKHDRQYYPSLKDLVLKLTWSIGKVTSAERKGESKKVGKLLSDTFAWWVACVTFCEFRVSDTLWEKFPRVCPYCLVKKNCSCEGTKNGLNVESLEYHRRKNHRPRTLSEWQRMFAKIYGIENAKQGLDHAFARLPEEISEVIECIVPFNQNNYHLQLELADLGARIFAVAELLAIDLEATFLSQYRGVCPSCQKGECCCLPRAA